MDFTDNYYILREQLYSGTEAIVSPSGTHVEWLPFISGRSNTGEDYRYLKAMREIVPGASIDEGVGENREFSYPVFIPAGTIANDGCIIMLHGLNERKWDKYLTWADYLASKTGKSVILFPISFHLNRSLPEWIDRHSMMERAEARKMRFSLNDSQSTFINEALSDRLTEVPERFFLSGLQTAGDIVQLLQDIYDGKHPLFKRGTHSDIFAYSIGGLLAQVLFLANPDDLLSDSRLFLFCAGSLFHEMNGVSKLIMDPVAYHKIYHYYLSDLEKQIKKSDLFSEYFNRNKIGMAFRSMIAPDRFRNFRNRIFHQKAEQIFAISLKEDRVIPTPGISRALLGTSKRIPRNMVVTDFPFTHCHENPFPVKQESIRQLVDKAFDQVFTKAAVFMG